MRAWPYGILLVFLIIGSSVAQAQSLDLTQYPARQKIDDNPDFSAPDFDDHAWQTKPVISSAGWFDRGAGLGQQVIWYRIHFNGADLPPVAKPAIYVGTLMGGNAFYLNGHEIGSMAILDPPVGGHLSHHVKAFSKVFPFDPGILNPDGNNVLAIKSVQTGLENSGVLAPPLAITEYGPALAAAEPRNILFIVYGSGATLLFLFAMLTTCIAWLNNPKNIGMGWLVCAFLCYLPGTISVTSLVLYWDVPISPYLAPFLSTIIGMMVLIPLLNFSAHTLKAKIRWHIRLLQVGVTALVFTPDINSDVLFPVTQTDIAIWFVLCGLTFIQISIWSIRAAIQKLDTAYPVIIGSAAIWIWVIFVFTNAENWFYRNLGSGADEIAVTIFLYSLVWAETRSLLKDRKRLLKAQSQILRAQETERERIARDIHDGIGQWLSTIKLNLQMVQGTPNKAKNDSGLSESIEHIDTAIADIRRITHDLSSISIEKTGLTAAMHSHADFIARHTGIHIEILTDGIEILSLNMQGHIYRIFQEALKNAIQHGAATHITVNINLAHKKLSMTITDNGSGFDPKQKGQGLGIDSMEKRAALLGATLQVKSKSGCGTTIILESRLS